MSLTGPCQRCTKNVYAAELVIGPERKPYHKLCLTCGSCRKMLAPGGFQDHDGEPFCKNCYNRLFSAADLRRSNLPSSRPSVDINLGLGSSRRESLPLSSSPSSSSPSSTPLRGRYSLPLTSSTSEGFAEGAEERQSPNALSPSSTGSTTSPFRLSNGSPRGAFPVKQVLCPRCDKAVYHAEQVNAVGKKWHKSCLLCVICGKRLDTHNLADKDNEVYCRSCYNKLHGPAGAGYALLGKAGGG